MNQADFTGIGDTTTWNFTVTADSTPPAVTVFDPADDAVDVVIDANFVMTFDEPVAMPAAETSRSGRRWGMRCLKASTSPAGR